jgi:hypothetical protein
MLMLNPNKRGQVYEMDLEVRSGCSLACGSFAGLLSFTLVSSCSLFSDPVVVIVRQSRSRVQCWRDDSGDSYPGRQEQVCGTNQRGGGAWCGL